MVCKRCGAQIGVEEKFCPKCGADAQSFLDPDKDIKATLSLIFGIIGFFIPIIFSIVGIIMGRIGLKSTKRTRAIVGLTISIMAIIMVIIGAIFLLSSTLLF